MNVDKTRGEDPVVVADGDFLVRRVTGADIPLIASWLRDPVLTDWFGVQGEGALRDWFADNSAQGLVCCIVEYKGQPLGFVQYYRAHEPFWQKVHGYGPNERLWGMDQFIGDPGQRGRGLGRRFVRLVADHLIQECGATRIAMDVAADNEQAIRCYEAAGFRKVRWLPNHDDGSGPQEMWLMECAAGRPMDEL